MATLYKMDGWVRQGNIYTFVIWDVLLKSKPSFHCLEFNEGGVAGAGRGVGRMGRWERAHTNIYSHQCLKDLFFRIYILYNKST